MNSAKKSSFVFTLSLLFFIFASRVFAAETVTWNPDPLPNKSSGQILNFSVTINDAYPSTGYAVSESLYGGISAGVTGVSQISLTLNVSQAFCEGLRTFQLRRYVIGDGGFGGSYSVISSRTMTYNHAPSPDVLPDGLRACWQDTGNSKMSVLVSVEEKNQGDVIAGTHVSEVRVKPNGVCGGTYNTVSFKETTINSLTPSEVLTIFRDSAVATLVPIACVSQLTISATADSKNQIQESLSPSYCSEAQSAESNFSSTTYLPSCSAPTPTPTPTSSVTPTPTGVSPKGALNVANDICSSIIGWAGDPDKLLLPISVNLTAQGVGDTSPFPIGTVTASDIRTSPVCVALGGTAANCAVCDDPVLCTATSCPGQCKHGYSFTTPISLKNGTNYSIRAFGINYPGTGGSNILLTNSPRVLNCPAPSLGWFQVKGGNVHAVGSITSPVPNTATEKAFNLSLDGYPGTVSFTGSASFSPANVVSSTNWLANTTSTNSFSYASYYQKFGSPTSPVFTGVSSDITSGQSKTYYAPGSVTINNNFNFPNNTKAVIFINGDLNIDKEVSVPVGSFLAFIVKNNINIKGTVGDKKATAFTGINAHIQGVFLADEQINTNSDNDNSGNRLVGAGVFYAKMGFILKRDLRNAIANGGQVDNPTHPAELFISRPDLLINAPSSLFATSMSWQEVSP